MSDMPEYVAGQNDGSLMGYRAMTAVPCPKGPCDRCRGTGEVWIPVPPAPFYGGRLWWKWFGCRCGARLKSERDYEYHYWDKHGIPVESSEGL